MLFDMLKTSPSLWAQREDDVLYGLFPIKLALAERKFVIEQDFDVHWHEWIEKRERTIDV